MDGQSYQGTVLWFKKPRQYGFIRPDDESPDVFVHRKALAAPIAFMKKGQRVAYELRISQHRRWAERVTPLNKLG